MGKGCVANGCMQEGQVWLRLCVWWLHAGGAGAVESAQLMPVHRGAGQLC